MTDHMMCGGAYDYQCWNGVSADGPLAASKLIAAVLKAITEVAGCDEVLRDEVRAEVQRIHREQSGRRGELESRRKRLQKQRENVRMAIRDGAWSQSVSEDLQAIETEIDEIQSELAGFDRLPQQLISVPSLAEIRDNAVKAIGGLSLASPEFGRLMHRLILRIKVYPYRLCDGGHPVLRAKFTLDLVGLIPELQGVAVDTKILQREMIVDLFDPPQRAAYREQVMALKAQGLKQRDIASQLGITQPAVQAAIRLAAIWPDED